MESRGGEQQRREVSGVLNDMAWRLVAAIGGMLLLGYGVLVVLIARMACDTSCPDSRTGWIGLAVGAITLTAVAVAETRRSRR
jgi:hypothetical protein